MFLLNLISNSYFLVHFFLKNCCLVWVNSVHLSLHLKRRYVRVLFSRSLAHTYQYEKMKKKQRTNFANCECFVACIGSRASARSKKCLVNLRTERHSLLANHDHTRRTRYSAYTHMQLHKRVEGMIAAKRKRSHASCPYTSCSISPAVSLCPINYYILFEKECALALLQYISFFPDNYLFVLIYPNYSNKGRDHVFPIR